MRKWDLFVSFKIICRLHPWTARTHVRNPFVLPPCRFISFRRPSSDSRWMGGRFRGVTMNMLPNHGAYVCTGRRFLDNPATRDRIYIYYIQFAEFAQPTAIGTGFAYDRQMFTSDDSGVAPKARSSLVESHSSPLFDSRMSREFHISFRCVRYKRIL